MEPMQNAKNRLLERCQRDRLAPPLWQQPVRVVGTPDHCPLWLSTVVLWDGTACRGQPSRTKSEAEQSSAEQALSVLALRDLPPPPFVSTTTATSTTSVVETTRAPLATPVSLGTRGPRKALLIDVENLPKFATHLTEQQMREYVCYAFVGEHHALVDRELPPQVTRIVSPSTRPDGADSCIQVYAGCLAGQRCYDEIVVATRDHFGSALCDQLQSDTLLWSPVKARVVSQTKQL